MSFLYKFKTKQIFFSVIVLEALAIFLILNYIFTSLSEQTKNQALKNMQTMSLKISEQVDAELKKVQYTTKIVADAYMRNYEEIKRNDNYSIEEWKNKVIENTHTRSFIYDGVNSAKTPHLSHELQTFVDKTTTFDKEAVFRLEAAGKIKELFHGIYKNYNYSYIYISTYNNILHIYPTVNLAYEKHAAAPTTQHWYEAADFKNKTFGWEEPYSDLGGVGQMVTVSYPFYDKNEKLQGVVSHDITIQQILERFMKNIELYKGSTLLVISQNAKAISTNNQNFNNEIELKNKDSYRGLLYYLNENDLKELKLENNEVVNSQYTWLNNISSEVMKKLKNKQYDSFEFNTNNDKDETHQVSAVKIPTTNWIIINSVPNEIILGELNSSNRQMQIAITILLTILYLTIGVVYYVRFFVPIEEITKITNKIAHGDLNHKIQTSYKGEIGKLFSNYSKMLKNLILAKELSNEYNTKLEEEIKNRTAQIEEKNRLLLKLSITDKLTNLYNRNKLDEILIDEVNRANRSSKSFGVILIDIDYFKSVNDTYGHQMGDTVLKEFAQILEESSRKTDTVGRWGGEEFLIICSEANLEGILTLANKIKDRIQTNKFSIKEQKTASFGVAIYKKDENVNELIKRADEALYKAKEGGRNKVEAL